MSLGLPSPLRSKRAWGMWRTQLCKDRRTPLVSYNDQRKGSDRDALRDDASLIRSLLGCNSTGVFHKTSPRAGYELLDESLDICSGMGPNYVDELVWATQKLLVDLGRIRRRRKVQGILRWG
eukprot:8094818-Alexandrium_andersonii.AAC.1